MTAYAGIFGKLDPCVCNYLGGSAEFFVASAGLRDERRQLGITAALGQRLRLVCDTVHYTLVGQHILVEGLKHKGR